MNNFSYHNRMQRFANGNTRQNEALTLDAVRHYAPSAFAVDKHDSRSARYTYIPTSTVIEALMREGFQPFRAQQGRSRIPGKAEFTKHLIRFRHQTSIEAVRNGALDVSIPEVVLVNSHDGTSAYKLFAGIFRMVCTNGLIVADSMIGSLSVPHKGDIAHQVIEGSFQIVGQTTKTLEVVDDWKSLQLTAGDQQAFAEAAHILRFADAEGKVATPITAQQLLTARRAEDAGSEYRTGYGMRPSRVAAPDLWRTMNVVQENVIKGGLHGTQTATDPHTRRVTRRNVTTREVRGIDQDVKLNRALWHLAERMAELKKQAA